MFKKKFPSEHLIVVVGDVPRVTASILASLTSEGLRVRHVLAGSATRRIGDDRYEADLSDPAAIHELHGLLGGAEGSPVGGLINMLGLCDPFSRPGVDDPAVPLRASLWTFNLLKELQADLETSARVGGGWVVNLTALGGRFGLDRSLTSAIGPAGTLGVAKAFMREASSVAVKNVDVDPSLDPALLATLLVQELARGEEAVEIGLTAQGRCRLALRREEARPDADLDLSPESVVLVTGGAYGVTADVALGLARRYQPRLVLVGRSPLPEAEPADLAALDVQGLRKRLIEEARSTGARVLPAEIERKVQRHVRDRHIRASIAGFQAAGATVEYHALDVRDERKFGALLDDLYQRFGRIDGVVHGAGIIDDKRIQDKSPESFTQVFSTKVDAAITLSQKLRPESLRFLVFFSSVSGRFGNAGQADYGAANEFLNKLADWLDARWPGRVSAINWGPWDGGMVSDELRRMYAQVGFDLIPIAEGVDYFLDEIRRTNPSSAEVVISGSVAAMAGPHMS